MHDFLKGSRAELRTKRSNRETTKMNLCQKMKLLSSGTCFPANREFELPGYHLQCGKLEESDSLCKLLQSLVT